VAVGGDPERIAILDNFCWGNPLLPDRLGSLVRACKGCYDGALQYGTPYISGKDSLNNEYMDNVSGKLVAIPPSLLISSIAIVPDVRQTATSDLKRASDRLYLLGLTKRELGGSYYCRINDLQSSDVPRAAEAGPITARALHQAIHSGQVAACHDCSEGGLAVAIAEMCLAGQLGARIDLDQVACDDQLTATERLFSESNGRYLVEVAPEQAEAFEALLADTPFARIGETCAEPSLSVVNGNGGGTLLNLSIDDLRDAWRGHIAQAIQGGSER